MRANPITAGTVQAYYREKARQEILAKHRRGELPHLFTRNLIK